MIKPIDIPTWERFLETKQAATFLQSVGWKNFHDSLDYPTYMYGYYQDETLVSICLIIHIKARRGDHLLIPHGPIGDLDQHILSDWQQTWKNLASELACTFVRWQPVIAETTENLELAQKAGFRTAPLHAHTEHTSVVDISKPEKEILLTMRKTTRQMIRKGLKLAKTGDVSITYPDAIDEQMAQVYQDTYIRGGAVAYSNEYIRKEWQAFKAQDAAKLINVYHEGELLSWGMFIFNGTNAFYHQGGNHLHKKIPSSYICQWSGMKAAIAHGCKTYDFWGVTPPDASDDHPWKNISQFKRGFGGNDVSYLKAQDIVVSWKYWPNWLLESYRARKRGFK